MPPVSKPWNLFSLSLFYKPQNVVKRLIFIKNEKLQSFPLMTNSAWGCNSSLSLCRSEQKYWPPYDIKWPSCPCLRDRLTWNLHSWRVSSIAPQLQGVDVIDSCLLRVKRPEPQIRCASQLLNGLWTTGVHTGMLLKSPILLFNDSANHSISLFTWTAYNYYEHFIQHSGFKF